MSRHKKALHELAGTGDDGTTGLLGGGRAPKDDPRIEAYGTVDEASSSLGLAKALTGDARVREIVEVAQRDLYRLGAELATNPQRAGGFATMTEDDVERLDVTMAELEESITMPREFVLPGTTPGSAALDVARTVVRRAERRCIALYADGSVANQHVRRYLNRLSLLLFVLARFEEQRAGTSAAPARNSI